MYKTCVKLEVHLPNMKLKAIEQVTLFYEISNVLNEHLDLKKSMYKVLDILSSSIL
mgnify:CR=1 FL=1